MTEYLDTIFRDSEVAIGVRDYGGTGWPIVLLHGGGRNLADWRDIALLLTPQHRVVCMELRSHGQSTPGDTVWRFEDAVADLEALVAHFNLDNPFVVGHSLGGIVGTLYGATHPQGRGVVNIDGVGVSIPHRFPVSDPAQARQSLVSMIEGLVSTQPTESLPDSQLLTHEQVEERIAAVRQQQEEQGNNPAASVDYATRSYYLRPDGYYQENPSARAVHALSLAIMGFDLFAVTPQVRCPLLFLAAREQADTEVEIDPADLMRLWQAGVDLEVTDLARQHSNIHWARIQGDHLSIMHKHALLAAQVLNFIQMVSGTPSI
jgi:pimeloyl-ACP methyl ester carboxylesterase